MPDLQPHLKLSRRQASWAAAGAGSAPCGSALLAECWGQGSVCCAALGAPHPGVLGRGGPSAWRAVRDLVSCQPGAEPASAPWLGGAAWQGKPAQTMPSWGCLGASLQPRLSCLETTATSPASCRQAPLQGGAGSVTVALAESASDSHAALKPKILSRPWHHCDPVMRVPHQLKHVDWRRCFTFMSLVHGALRSRAGRETRAGKCLPAQGAGPGSLHTS